MTLGPSLICSQRLNTGDGYPSNKHASNKVKRLFFPFVFIFSVSISLVSRTIGDACLLASEYFVWYRHGIWHLGRSHKSSRGDSSRWSWKPKWHQAIFFFVVYLFIFREKPPLVRRRALSSWLRGPGGSRRSRGGGGSLECLKWTCRLFLLTHGRPDQSALWVPPPRGSDATSVL